MFYRYLILLLFTFPLSAQQIDIAVNASLMNVLKTHSFKPCAKDATFKNFATFERVLDLFILCRALHEAKFDFSPKFIEVPNKLRGFWLVKEGKVHLSSALMHKNIEIKKEIALKKLNVTEAVKPKEDSLYAFYTSVNNEKAKQVASFEDLSELTAAVPNTWKRQIAILESLDIKYQLVQYRNIPKFISHNRADIALLRVRSRKFINKTLFEVPLVLAGNFMVNTTGNTLHFIASNQFPESQRLIKALDQGLEIISSNGLLKTAYHENIPDLSVKKEWQTILPDGVVDTGSVQNKEQ